MDNLKNIVSLIRNGDSLIKVRTLIYILDENIKLPLKYIYERLTDQNKEVQAVAAFVLSKLGNKSSVKHLVAAWLSSTNKDVHLKRQILIAILDIAGILGLKSLVGSFYSWPFELQVLVIEHATAYRGDRKVMSFLKKNLKDQNLSKKVMKMFKKNNIL